MGFLLYCAIAFGLLAARIWLRRSAARPSAARRPAGRHAGGPS